MLNGKKVAVILPAYNAALTLEKTYNEIPRDIVDQVILVDDNSRDDTVEVAKRLGIHTVVHLENKGYGGNQKTCYTEALKLGADIVIHSTSKYLSGHTNVIGGAVVAKELEVLDKLKFIHNATGGVPGPFDCYLTMLGIKTLAVRMKQHCTNAQKVAEFLNEHNKIRKVHYPGLTAHPQHALAKSQMSGFGGILSFEIDGDEDAAKRFLDSLTLFALTISFGSVASLVNYPAKMSHKEMPREERIQRGFGDSLIRMSIGIEKDTDIISDIEGALLKV